MAGGLIVSTTDETAFVPVGGKVPESLTHCQPIPFHPTYHLFPR